MHDEKRGPGRPRKEERRRRNSLETVGKRLAVNMSSLDFDKFKYRWVNDTPARIFQMTQQDEWEIVTPEGGVVKDDNADLGSAVSTVVRDHNGNGGMRVYLCRKRREWYEEDQKQKQTELDEQLEQMRRGLTGQGESQSDYVPGKDTPGGAIKIA